MSKRFHRRQLLQGAATAAGAVAASRLFPAPAVLAQASPNSKINVAVIGCANQGSISVNEIARLGEQIVAFADVDDKQFGKAEKLLAESYPEIKSSAIQQFHDYRKMLDKARWGIM